ncbi:hypothetical protein L218DRAFT_934712 [Marasmius fiardii PR-910]|nr:hypothetical protein L218DRAFT_934712 [Marasmius fiardii PR-910]
MATTGAGLTMLYYAVGLICQTFVYGTYVLLITLSTFSMIKNGPLKTPIRKFIFSMSLFAFLNSTLFLIFKTIRFVKYFYGSFILDPPLPPPMTDPVNRGEIIISAICIINYVLSDCTVVWRAWVLCRVDYKHLLYIPLFFLFLFTGTCIATIVIRFAAEFTRPSPSAPENPIFRRSINICQFANLVFSLVINVTATVIVAFKAWRHRRWIKEDLNLGHGKRTRGEKVLILLVETGLLYCLGWIMLLLFSIIPIPTGGTLGALYTPIHVQIAGMYPVIVLFLVSRGMSLEQTSFHCKTGEGGVAVQAITCRTRESPSTSNGTGSAPQLQPIQVRSTITRMSSVSEL